MTTATVFHDPEYQQLAAARDSRLTAILRTLDGGALQIFAGTRPEPGEPEADAVQLVELPLPAPAFREPADGRAESHPLQPANATAAGTASWWRLVTADGRPAIDGSVGVGLRLNSTEVARGATFSINSFAFTFASVR